MCICTRENFSHIKDKAASSFFTPLKCQKTRCFLTFSEGIEMKPSARIG